MKRFSKIVPIIVVIIALVLAVSACSNNVTCNVNFIVDGEVYATVTTGTQGTIMLPKDPVKQGYVFKGWYWDGGVWSNQFTLNSLMNQPRSESVNVYALFTAEQDANEQSSGEHNGNGETNNGQTNNGQTSDEQSSGEQNQSSGDNHSNETDPTHQNPDESKTTVVVSFATMGAGTIASVEVERGSRITEPSLLTKAGYTFGGWYIDSEYKLKWDFRTDLVQNSFTLYAKWIENTETSITYRIEFDLNGGTSSDALTVQYEAGSAIRFPSVVRNGYTLKGWTYGDGNVWTTAATVSGSLVLKAEWEPIVYKITYHLDGGINYVGNPSTYTILSADIAFADPTKENSTFAGWFSNASLTSSITGISSGSSGDIDIYAAWTKQASGSSEAQFVRDGDTLYFGSYPQSKVTDTNLNKKLSSIAGTPTANSNGVWKSYRYYEKGSNKTDYMWYVDLSLGGEKYRGVYFTSYRPYYTNQAAFALYSVQDEYNYKTSTVYWFKYESIKWRILSEKNGDALLLCEMILDSQEYYSTNYSSSFGHNGGTGYANNYALSNIRKWLNDTFYNTAFADLQKQLILLSKVDNSARSTNPNLNATEWNAGANTYACADTQDYIFLLSEQDVTNSAYGFDSAYSNYDSARQKKNTDYAKSQGVWIYSSAGYVGNGCWWLRSPNYSKNDAVNYVKGDGSCSESELVHNTGYGVVPALWIKLDPNGGNQGNQGSDEQNPGGENNNPGSGNDPAGQNETATYRIEFDLNGGTSNDELVVQYEAGSLIEFPSVTRKGYTLKAWIYGNGSVWNASKTVDGAVVLKAQWDPTVYKITYHLDGGINDGFNPSTYTIASDKIVFADPMKNDYDFLGWFSNASLTSSITGISSGSTGDVDVYAAWTKQTPVSSDALFVREGDYLYFGSYPQTKVTDANLNNRLSVIAGTPTGNNNGGWKSYKYYADGSNGTDYMWYVDLPFGGEKYRGVYFDQYRPNRTNASSSLVNSNQDDNGYRASTVYWFKYEPIKWRILPDENNGAVLVICEMIMDSQEFYSGTGTRTINGKLVSADDYAESNIRKWLNDTFYNTAFDASRKELIVYGALGDSVSMLGYNEAKKTNYGFDSDYSKMDGGRQKKPTDYAKAQGVYTNKDSELFSGNGNWWTNSADAYKKIYYADYRGTLENTADVNSTNIGILPVLWVKLSDSSSSQEKTTTIYYKNANWSSVNAYAWSDSEGSVANYLGNFPGSAMERVGGYDGWWSISVNVKAEKILFSNGTDGNDKTADLVINYANPHYDGTNWLTDLPYVPSWDGVLTVNTSAISWFETDDCRASIFITYYDNSTNAAYPGEGMRRTSANVYTVQTDVTKTIASVRIVRMHQSGVYMYNKTGVIGAEDIPTNHTISLSESNFSELSLNERTPNSALTFNITWQYFDTATPRLYVLYRDGTAYTSSDGVLVKTEKGSNTYTVAWSSVISAQKTISYFKILRCDPSDLNKVWHESSEFTTADIEESRVITVSSMDAKVIHTYKTVYFYNEYEWTSVNAYAWSGSGIGAITYLGTYPGSAMTEVNGKEGWWSISVNVKAEKIIFSSSTVETAKTYDLVIDYDNPYYDGEKWIESFMREYTSETKYVREGDTLYFGTYPQKQVADADLSSQLSAVAGTPTGNNNGNWKSYKYYADGSNETDYMWYVDLSYGGEKYRGVYFNQYRPNKTNASATLANSNQDDNGYRDSTVYWFKYEPIKWRILPDENNGAVLVICEMIIDSQEFYSGTGTRTINGKTVSADDYAASNIRKWLNDTFYNTAFDASRKELIVCGALGDSVSMLGYNEAKKTNYGFDSDYSKMDGGRQKKPTDYAKAQGVYANKDSELFSGNGNWWTNSADAYKKIYYADYRGTLENTADVNSTNIGILPVMWVLLD